MAGHVYNPLAENYNKNEMVMLIAFAGQMIAANSFNNVVEADIGDYLAPWLPPVKSIWKNS